MPGTVLNAYLPISAPRHAAQERLGSGTVDIDPFSGRALSPLAVDEVANVELLVVGGEGWGDAINIGAGIPRKTGGII